MFDIVESCRGDRHWKFRYYMGALCVEALIAVYVTDKVIDNFELVGKLGFKEAFKKAFGLSPAAFRVKVIPYILERHERDNMIMRPFEI